MAIIISIALQKGGVGKSTTAQALASILGTRHNKVLLIDMDSQHNVTYSSGIDNPERSITDVLGEDCKVDDAIIPCKYYDILAADDYLSNVEMAEVKPTLLRDAISPLRDRYDFIIIDTPPALGNLSYNSLVTSDYVVVTCEPSIYGLQGLSALNRTIKDVQKRQNKNLKVIGILLVKYNSRTILNRDIKDMIEDYSKQMDSAVFSTKIREGVVVREAQTVRKPLVDYGKNSKPNIDYEAFTYELLERIKG